MQASWPILRENYEILIQNFTALAMRFSCDFDGPLDCSLWVSSPIPETLFSVALVA